MSTEKQKENLENVIEIKNVRKEYKMYKSKKARLFEAVLPFYNNHDTFSAINNLNLELHKGEVLGILGKNGAGKSTLLKMITGVVTPTSGELKINGKLSSLLELGAAFNMELTGEENIYQHGQVMGLTNEQIEATKQDIIDFADIGHHLYQPVKTYSSGMFARLAFACAINVDPDILIVDEVLSVGDMAFQLKCFKKFQQFKEKGKTIIFVSHNVNDIIKNCNRAIILKEGEKIFDGDVKPAVDIYKKIMVGLDESLNSKEDKEENIEIINDENIDKKNNEKEIWKSNFTTNESQISYGDGSVEIIDYGIFDENGEYKANINNSDKYSIKMKIKFNKDIYSPIFALSIKDFKGLEIAGANTEVYKTQTGEYKQGQTIIVEFKQSIPLAPDKYTLSFGCTTFDENGNLKVYDRKYDVIIFEITSNRPSLGTVDLKTDIKISEC
ncbi:MAG: ABC transporter ATP-binding protein [Clostridia bacterium]|nr:ABC transporter ATP-binding protein [Clostridia bacterium]